MQSSFGYFLNAISTAEMARVKPWSQDWFIAAGAYPDFCSMKRLGVFLFPLDGMLDHRRSLPSLPRNLLGFSKQFAGTHLYPWVETGTVKVECLRNGQRQLKNLYIKVNQEGYTTEIVRCS